MTVLMIGGAGFIGSAVVHRLICETDETVINLEKLTPSGNLQSQRTARDDPSQVSEQVDICNVGEVALAISLSATSAFERGAALGNPITIALSVYCKFTYARMPT